MTVDGGRVDPQGDPERVMPGAPDDLDPPLDDALVWEGDEERGLEAPRRRRAAMAAADARADGDAEDGDGDDDDAPATSAPVLVGIGVLAGISLIWLLGWVSVVGASTITFTDVLGEVMYQLGEFLAIASPAIWFAAVLVLARDRPVATRIRWHALGLLVTAPWPLLIGAIT